MNAGLIALGSSWTAAFGRANHMSGGRQGAASSLARLAACSAPRPPPQSLLLLLRRHRLSRCAPRFWAPRPPIARDKTWYTRVWTRVTCALLLCFAAADRKKKGRARRARDEQTGALLCGSLFRVRVVGRAYVNEALGVQGCVRGRRKLSLKYGSLQTRRAFASFRRAARRRARARRPERGATRERGERGGGGGRDELVRRQVRARARHSNYTKDCGARR